jgi:hypothetical protein
VKRIPWRTIGALFLRAVKATGRLAVGAGRRIASFITEGFWDLLWMTGLALLSRGLWLVYPPAGWIGPSLIVIPLGIWMSGAVGSKPGGRERGD